MPFILLSYERVYGDRDDCLQPEARLQAVPGGVSKSLRASKHSIGAVYARDITDETIHGDRLDADRDRRRVFQEGNIGGVSRTLKAGNPNTCIVLTREITDESETIHRDVEQRTKQRLGETHNA